MLNFLKRTCLLNLNFLFLGFKKGIMVLSDIICKYYGRVLSDLFYKTVINAFYEGYCKKWIKLIQIKIEIFELTSLYEEFQRV